MKEHKGQFKKGVSGNPKGRPKGSRNAATNAALALLEGEAEALSRKAIEMALAGDVIALRLCLERIAPPIRERQIQGVSITAPTGPEDVADSVGQLVTLLASGEVLPSEAAAICAVLEQYRRHSEAADLDARIEKIENLLGAGQGRVVSVI